MGSNSGFKVPIIYVFAKLLPRQRYERVGLYLLLYIYTNYKYPSYTCLIKLSK